MSLGNPKIDPMGPVGPTGDAPAPGWDPGLPGSSFSCSGAHFRAQELIVRAPELIFVLRSSCSCSGGSQNGGPQSMPELDQQFRNLAGGKGARRPRPNFQKHERAQNSTLKTYTNDRLVHRGGSGGLGAFRRLPAA